MTAESPGKKIKMVHVQSLYSCRMAQETEMVALCALVNSVYRGETAKDGWTTEADLLDGQRCDLMMLKDLVAKPNSGFLVLCNTEEIVACCYLQLVETEVAECGMLSVTPT